MTVNRLAAGLAAIACVGVLLAGCTDTPPAGPAVEPIALDTGTDLDGLLAATLVFTAADADGDGAVTGDELTAAVTEWVDAAGGEAATRDDLAPVLDEALPMSGLMAAFNMGGGEQPETPDPRTVDAMMAALPERAPATPASARRVLVLAHAGGFVHSSIPLAAATVEALGTATDAWTTTITYDPADITADNLAQYDAVFLASTTGAFLDDPDSEATTMARREALLDFVRSCKGLAGIHAAADSYHRSGAPSAGGGGGGDPFGSFSAGDVLAPLMLDQGDRDGTGSLDRAEAERLAESWFATLDADGTGDLTQPEFAFFALLVPRSGAEVAQGPDTQVGTWPAFNEMIGGYFKFHWLDPQQVTVKIDDPESPLTAMFKAPFDVHDEIYTMGVNSWSRENVHVLTSIDYDAMSPEDRALEAYPRPDQDFGLSWIRRDGDGRVFYLALGHSERIYTTPLILAHLLAGIQYALGDLPADDSPSR